MNDITPEDLKLIAEYLGYKPIRIVKYLDRFVYEAGGRNLEYDPLTNDSQCMELMEKLYQQRLRLNSIHTNGKVSSYEVNTWGGIPIGSGKTINEAVTRAMIAKVKEE